MTHGMPCQENVGFADFWYFDDGDILCHPLLVLSYLQAFDAADVKVGSKRMPVEVCRPQPCRQCPQKPNAFSDLPLRLDPRWITAWADG